MSWEKRRNGWYYYRAFRENGRVVKRYVGGGTAGEAAAEQDAARRAERAAERQEEQRHRQADLALSQHVLSVAGESAALLEAALLVAGLHRPQRKPWRKRRSRRIDNGKPKN